MESGEKYHRINTKKALFICFCFGTFVFSALYLARALRVVLFFLRPIFYRAFRRAEKPRKEQSAKIYYNFRGGLLSPGLYLVFADVSYGADGGDPCAEPSHRGRRVVHFPDTPDICHAHFAFGAEIFQEYKHIFVPAFDRLPVCHSGVGAVVVHVGAHMGEGFGGALYKFVFHPEPVAFWHILREFRRHFF
jgi:hypothetical protein